MLDLKTEHQARLEEIRAARLSGRAIHSPDQAPEPKSLPDLNRTIRASAEILAGFRPRIKIQIEPAFKRLQRQGQPTYGLALSVPASERLADRTDALGGDGFTDDVLDWIYSHSPSFAATVRLTGEAEIVREVHVVASGPWDAIYKAAQEVPAGWHVAEVFPDDDAEPREAVAKAFIEAVEVQSRPQRKRRRRMPR